MRNKPTQLSFRKRVIYVQVLAATNKTQLATECFVLRASGSGGDVTDLGYGAVDVGAEQSAGY